MITPEAYIRQRVAEQGLSPQDIRLGLDRIAAVLMHMNIRRPPFIFTLAGTNGKGSCAHLIYVALLQAGYPAALFTSPHLLRFNERAQIGGEIIGDEEWLLSLRSVSQAQAQAQIKKKVKLTYFEYCALAAFDLFSRSSASPWVLEVGLGGRLDAVNVLDTNCAIITSIDIDHTERLGNNRASIALEKLGIARRDAPLIYGDPNPPPQMLLKARQMGARLLSVNQDYGARGVVLNESRFADDPSLEYYALANAAIDGKPNAVARDNRRTSLRVVNSDQLAINLATAWQALNALKDWDAECIASAWQNTQLMGRWQKVRLGRHLLVFDTGHNVQAARVMIHRLRAEKFSQSAPQIIFAMRADKNWQEFLEIMAPHIRDWHLFPLFIQNKKGESEEISIPKRQLLAKLRAQGAQAHWYQSAKQLIAAIRSRSQPTLFWVCGSFRTLGETMSQLPVADEVLGA